MAWIKGLVIGMGVLIAAGFVVVVVTLVDRVGGREAAGDGPVQATIALAPGERVIESSLDGGRILLRIDGPDGARIEVRSLADGAVLGAFSVVEEGR